MPGKQENFGNVRDQACRDRCMCVSQKPQDAGAANSVLRCLEFPKNSAEELARPSCGYETGCPSVLSETNQG